MEGQICTQSRSDSSQGNSGNHGDSSPISDMSRVYWLHHRNKYCIVPLDVARNPSNLSLLLLGGMFSVLLVVCGSLICYIVVLSYYQYKCDLNFLSSNYEVKMWWIPFWCMSGYKHPNCTCNISISTQAVIWGLSYNYKVKFAPPPPTHTHTVSVNLDLLSICLYSCYKRCFPNCLWRVTLLQCIDIILLLLWCDKQQLE